MIVLSILGGVLFLCSGAFLVRYASRRVTRQPVGNAYEQERAVLAGVLDVPALWADVEALRVDDFYDAEHRALWTALVEAFGVSAVHGAPEEQRSVNGANVDVVAGAGPEDDADDGASQVIVVGALDSKTTTSAELLSCLPEELRAKAAELANESRHGRDVVESGGDYADLPKGAQRRVRNGLIKAGYAVLGAANDRGPLSGKGFVEETGIREKPLSRVHMYPTPRRTIFVTVLLVLAGALSPWFVSRAGLSGAGLVLVSVALWALTAQGALIALVDEDTMYLDLPVFWVGSFVVWGLMCMGMIAGHEGDRLWSGLGIVLGVALLFEIVNFAYKVLRGRTGLGFGDTMIIVVTAGIPAALWGLWWVGAMSVIVGMLVSILVWLVLFVGGKLGFLEPMTRETPFAFGPYLELGWVLALILHTLAPTLN